MKRWMKAAAALLFSTAAANAQIFTWTAAGDKVGNSEMASMIWLNSHGLGDMISVATRLKAHPAGMRCLFLTCDTHSIFNEPSDLLPGKMKSLWWPNGIAKAAAGEQLLIAQLRNASVTPDYFLLDNEDAPNRWNMSPANLATVAADPRGMALGIPKNIVGNEDQGLVFDTISGRLAGAAMQQGVFAPLMAYAPQAVYAQFGVFLCSAEQGLALRDINGHAIFGDTMLGNMQNPAIYGSRGQATITQTPYGDAVYSANALRVAASHGKVMPWYSGDSVDQAVWIGTNFWSETIRHGLLTCGLRGLLFDADQPTAAKKVSDLYLETKQATGGALPTTMCTSEMIDPAQPYFYTARADSWNGTTPASKIVGRVTFAPGVTTATFTVAGRSFTTKPAAGQSGAWFTYTASTAVTLPTKKKITTTTSSPPTTTTNTGATWFDREDLTKRKIIPR